jgi:hypothetical protein
MQPRFQRYGRYFKGHPHGTTIVATVVFESAVADVNPGLICDDGAATG